MMAPMPTNHYSAAALHAIVGDFVNMNCTVEKMEILIFALIASYDAHRRQERVVAGPEELQPFDLQALRKTTDSKPSRSSSCREANLPTNRLTSSAMESVRFRRGSSCMLRTDPEC